ncbi:MAG: DUF305 domain-containing protein [Pyrinomonadaceae bacterium]
MPFCSEPKLRHLTLCSVFLMGCLSVSVGAQQTNTQVGPVVVQPGAPGQPSRVLPASTRGILPPVSKKDIEFMQGMIMHHEQAVVMTALIESRTENRDIRLIGGRISKAQTDEINFMKRWLESRGQPIASPKPMVHGSGSEMLMPGMLTPIQIGALMRAKGLDFDRLFLLGMIQHHNGALVMVKELFDGPGAGQDAELFNFASDVDSGQRAEIKSMETLLSRKP